MNKTIQVKDRVNKKDVNITIPETIQTAWGEAIHRVSHFEDENEEWCDDMYPISQGYHVIHEGRLHHVYQEKKIAHEEDCADEEANEMMEGW